MSRNRALRLGLGVLLMSLRTVTRTGKFFQGGWVGKQDIRKSSGFSGYFITIPFTSFCPLVEELYFQIKRFSQ